MQKIVRPREPQRADCWVFRLTVAIIRAIMQAARSILLLIVPVVVFAQTDKDINFPRTDEIQLAVSQAERAFDQYERSIALEGGLPSMQKDKTAVERDGETLKSARSMTASLKKKPEALHGLGGFLLLGLLDDASRNAALCAGSAFSEIGGGLLSGQGLDRAKAYEYLNVAQACQDVSVQLYTVSENVHALMVRELEGQQAVNQQATDMLTKCTAILKSAKAGGK